MKIYVIRICVKNVRSYRRYVKNFVSAVNVHMYKLLSFTAASSPNRNNYVCLFNAMSKNHDQARFDHYLFSHMAIVTGKY